MKAYTAPKLVDVTAHGDSGRPFRAARASANAQMAGLERRRPLHDRGGAAALPGRIAIVKASEGVTEAARREAFRLHFPPFET